MADVRTYSKDFLKVFIEEYRSLPCLWKIKSRDYSDRNKKNVAYGKMVNILKKVEPDANRDLAVKKINSLPSSHRKEKKKVIESERSGAGTEDVYVPSLWYYDLLEFLNDQEIPRRPISNFDEEVSQDETDLDFYDINSPQESRPPSQSSTISSGLENRQDELPPTPSYRTMSAVPPRPVKNKKKQSELDELLSSVGKRIKEENTEDKHDAFGRNVAYKLRNLPNDQRIYLEKIINDAIFEAELGNLNRNSIIHLPTGQTPLNIATNNSMLPSTSTYLMPVYNPQSSLDGGAENFSNDLRYLNVGATQPEISNYINNFKP